MATTIERTRELFRVGIQPPADPAGAYRVTYTPRKPANGRTNGLLPEVNVPDNVSVADVRNGNVEWVVPPPDAWKPGLEVDARVRAEHIAPWLTALDGLFRDIRTWLDGEEWSFRSVTKNIDDSEAGRYPAPALLMQAGTDRLIADPSSRSRDELAGGVDLYIMPQYDDVATLDFLDGAWTILRRFDPEEAGGLGRGPAVPLTRESLTDLLARMREHAHKQ